MSGKKKSLLILPGFAVMVLGGVSCSPLSKEASRSSDHIPSQIPEAPRIEPIGSEDAKIQIRFIFNSRNLCHDSTVDFMKKLSQAVPERIRVEFLDMERDEGFEAREEAGINCQAALIINGQYEFDLEQDGKKLHVQLLGPVGDQTEEGGIPPDYLQRVLEQELEQQYGAELTDKEREKLAEMWEALHTMPKASKQDGGPMDAGSKEPGPMGPGA